jgi:hypothetical protein
MKGSQNDLIKSALERGRKITPLSALAQFDCMRLGARIFNLRAQGMKINSRMVEHNGKRFAEYRIAP